jgi:hypothetical protein
VYQSLIDLGCQATYDLEAAIKVQQETELAEETQRQETMRLAAEQEEKEEKERLERMETAMREIETAERDLDAKRQSLREVQKDVVDNLEVGNGENVDRIEEEDEDEDEGSESAAGSLPATDNKSVSPFLRTPHPTFTKYPMYSIRARARRSRPPVRPSGPLAKRSNRSSTPR